MKKILYYIFWVLWQTIHIASHGFIFTNMNTLPSFIEKNWCEVEIIFHLGSVLLIAKTIEYDSNLKSWIGALLSCISVYYYDKQCSASFQNVLIDCPNSQYLPHSVVWTTAILFVIGNCISQNFGTKNMWMRSFLILFLIVQETMVDQTKRAIIFFGYRLFFAGLVFSQIPNDKVSTKVD